MPAQSIYWLVVIGNRCSYAHVVIPSHDRVGGGKPNCHFVSV